MKGDEAKVAGEVLPRLASAVGGGSDDGSDSDGPPPAAPPRHHRRAAAASSSPEDAEEALKKKQKQRATFVYAVEEALHNEADWRAKLSRIVTRLLPALQAHADNPDVLCPQQLPEQLLGRFRELAALHDKVWSGYEQRLQRAGHGDAPLPARRGSLAADAAPPATSDECRAVALRRATAFGEELAFASHFFKLYTAFVQELQSEQHGLQLYVRTATNAPGFREAMAAALQEAGLRSGLLLQDVTNIFSTPFSRIMRLPMPLKEALNNLPEKGGEGGGCAVNGSGGDDDDETTKARAALAEAVKSLSSTCKSVNRAQGDVDRGWLSTMANYSSNRPRTFALVTPTRTIAAQVACTVRDHTSADSLRSTSATASASPAAAAGTVAGAAVAHVQALVSGRAWPREATLTLCNDCAILTAELDFGPASMDILHVFRDIYRFRVVEVAGGGGGGGGGTGRAAQVELELRDTAAAIQQTLHVTMTRTALDKLHEHLESLEGGDAKPRFPRLDLVPHTQQINCLSLLLMPMEVVWFSFFCIIALVLQALFPDAVYHESKLAWFANRMVLKQVGYFLPLACLQLLHFVHSRKSFWDQFVCNDLASWLYVYTFTRFIFEPSVHVVSSMLLGNWVSGHGVASHLLMTYVSWGFALLVTDQRWFVPPRDETTGAPTRRTAYTAGLVLVAAALAMYTWMGFITCRYYHNAVDWVLAVATASLVLSLLALGVRKSKKDPGSIGRIVAWSAVAETGLAFLLVVYNALDTSGGAAGGVGALEALLSKVLKYVFWANPLSIKSYFVSAFFVAAAAFVRYCFLKPARWVWLVLLPLREVAGGAVVLAALLGVSAAVSQRNGSGSGGSDGSGGVHPDVVQASVAVAVVNTLAAQAVTLFARHSTDIRHLGECDFTQATGPFAKILALYRRVMGNSGAEDAGVLRPVARFFVWVVAMGYTQVLFASMLQIAHAEAQLQLAFFGSFWVWLLFALVVSAVFHVLFRVSERACQQLCVVRRPHMD